MKWIIRIKSLAAMAFCIITVTAVCFGTATAAPDNEKHAVNQALIKSVEPQGSGTGFELVVAVSAPVAYTSYKTTSPDRMVIDFSQTIPAESLNALSLNQGPVNGVTIKRFDTDAGVLTRMEIFLTQKIEPLIAPSPDKTGELRISFPGYTPETTEVSAKKDTLDTAQLPEQSPDKITNEAKNNPTQIKSEVQFKPASEQKSETGDHPSITDVVASQDAISIVITGGAVNEFKTFRLNKPERVIIDLPNVKAGTLNKLIQLNNAGVSTARIGSYPDKARIVLDAINGTLPDAIIEKTSDGLKVQFPTGAKKSPSASAASSVGAGATSTESVKNTATKTESAPAVPAKIVEVKKNEPAVIQNKKAASPARVPIPFAVSQVQAVDFQVFEQFTRVTVKASSEPVVDNPVKQPGTISFRIRNAQLPRSLQRSFETRDFITPVLRITPVQIQTKSGKDVMIRVAMRSDAPFEFSRESDLLYLDLKHSEEIGLKIKAKAAQTAQTVAKKSDTPKPVTPPPAAASDKSSKTVASSQKAAEPTVSATPAAATPVDQIIKAGETSVATGRHEYTGRKVTLEFADAEVRKIFQLLSEVSNKNFVLGDEVTGTISLKLVNVPWDQALDIILDTKGLDKREEGNIVLIRGKGKFKSLLDEEVEIRKAALKGEPLITEMFDINYADLASITTQFNALKTDRGMITQDLRTNKIIVKDVKVAIEDMRKILKSLDIPEKQVMIEARIVEASTSFTQSLGVNWGIHYRDGSGSIAGINSMDTSFGGLASNVPPATGVSGSPGGSAGISFGTLSSNIKLDLRLNAAVSAGMVRIVSTPKVATLNHKSAKITQGQQIPYTSSTSDKVETKFVEAALALEVTPHINPNGTIVMKIDAKNDAPGSQGSPPPINKKQATTEMMLRDGETTVIGGIYVESESNSDDGVPYLKDIPWFGGLFKSTDQKRNRTELLIFITPRIINTNP